MMSPHRQNRAPAPASGLPGGGVGGPLHRHPTGGGSGSDAHGEGQVYYLRYGINSRLEAGLGYWGTSAKPRPGAAWQAVTQTARRPALLVGYGSEPMGNWRDDGAYVSMVKGFGPPQRRWHAFLACFHEIDGNTNHVMVGTNHPIGSHWSLFVGRYPFNTWEGALSYQLSSQVQFGFWAADFGRATRLGVSVGTG